MSLKARLLVQWIGREHGVLPPSVTGLLRGWAKACVAMNKGMAAHIRALAAPDGLEVVGLANALVITVTNAL